MNTNISFDQAVNAFVVVCNTMFFYLGILPQEIASSPYYDSFKVATYNFAYVMVHSSIYSGKVKALCSPEDYEEDEIINLLAFEILRKYCQITIAMSKNGDEMDLKNYASTIVRNNLNSLLRKKNNHSKKDNKNKSEEKPSTNKEAEKTKRNSKELKVKWMRNWLLMDELRYWICRSPKNQLRKKELLMRKETKKQTIRCTAI